METDINETENVGMKDETRGNRDGWRGVRRCDGNRTDLRTERV